MKKIIFAITVLCIFISMVWANEIPVDKYVFIHAHTNISGESTEPYLNIDFPTYNYDTGPGVLISMIDFEFTDATQVIMGSGLSLGGSVGGGASTGLTAYDNLVEEDKFIIQPDGSAEIYYGQQWISLLPGETWTETLYTDSYYSFSGNLVVNFTVSNFGLWDKALIDAPNLDPTPTPIPTRQCGDVNSDGEVTIMDALLVAQYYAGLIQTFAAPQGADVNSDGNINIVDALLIAQYYIGLPVTLECL